MYLSSKKVVEFSIQSFLLSPLERRKECSYFCFLLKRLFVVDVVVVVAVAVGLLPFLLRGSFHNWQPHRSWPVRCRCRRPTAGDETRRFSNDQLRGGSSTLRGTAKSAYTCAYGIQIRIHVCIHKCVHLLIQIRLHKRIHIHKNAHKRHSGNMLYIVSDI